MVAREIGVAGAVEGHRAAAAAVWSSSRPSSAVARHDPGRRRRWSRSGSIPHDAAHGDGCARSAGSRLVTARLARWLPLRPSRPRRPCGMPRQWGQERCAGPPAPRQAITPHLHHTIARRPQIPIGRARRQRDPTPSLSDPRFPPPEVFRRRPQGQAAAFVSGRHQKTFTKAATTLCRRECPLRHFDRPKPPVRIRP
ncbi:hypothetical protein SAMN05444161_1807 [Rhizobiales bacterium GAS191]|nr:hypothetical protein SAMN05444161_1807 [Rhizobiales bacterium GAS191]